MSSFGYLRRRWCNQSGVPLTCDDPEPYCITTHPLSLDPPLEFR